MSMIGYHFQSIGEEPGWHFTKVVDQPMSIYDMAAAALKESKQHDSDVLVTELGGCGKIVTCFRCFYKKKPTSGDEAVINEATEYLRNLRDTCKDTSESVQHSLSAAANHIELTVGDWE